MRSRLRSDPMGRGLLCIPRAQTSPGREFSVRAGLAVTRHAHWFERLLAELGFELFIGDPAEIRAKWARKQQARRSMLNFGDLFLPIG